MSALPDTTAVCAFQTAFAARIRDPRGQPRLPEVPAWHMRVYEELLFNNLEGFLLACFPVTRRLLGVRAWRKTVRRFFAEHRCVSPLFRDIPGAFLAWIEPLADSLFPAFPYLYEFMHYEWLELAVSTSEGALDPARVDPHGDLLETRPLLNPTAQLACYLYPVHRISPNFRPTKPDGQFHGYLVYRDGDDVVQFMVLNPASARLVQLLRDGAGSGREVLLRLAGELGQTQSESFVEMGRSLLLGLRHAGAVSGTRSPV